MRNLRCEILKTHSAYEKFDAEAWDDYANFFILHLKQ